jgi:hypothetical protein
MNPLRGLATIVTSALVVAVISLYGVQAARSSDHQDSPTVVARPGADITDVYAYPAPNNAKNVVLTMDVYPLIPGGMSSNAQYAFDPAVLYQFKIANGIANKNYNESLVMQFTVNGAGQGQTLTMYGPSAPNEVSTNDTIVTAAKMGTVTFNQPGTVDNGQIQLFAGTRRDPFFFDLAQFFKILPDRNAAYHAPGQSVPPPSATSFNGFAPGNASGCSTAPPSDFLSNYNVLQIAVELPKTMLEPSGAPLGKIGLWATTSTTTGS